MQKKLSHRVGEHRILAKVADFLATLAVHKLNYAPQLLRNETSKTAFPEDSPALKGLFQNLAQPLDQMQNVEGSIDLDDLSTVSLDFVKDPLLDRLRESGDITAEIRFSCRKEDFCAAGVNQNHFPREKKGLIRLFIKLTFSRSGAYVINEEFRFACRVKITGAFAPVLSKFNLYIENAGVAGQDFFNGYNQVSVDHTGNFCGTRKRVRPMVLNNDGGANLKMKTKYTEFVEEPRGLVYLGGPSRIILNLARSDLNHPTSDSGEGFHSFREKGIDGWVHRNRQFTSSGKEEIIAVEMEQGVSDDPHPDAKSWYKPIESGFLGQFAVEAFRMKYASIFRLFGVQRQQSPTLVLGDVKSSFLLLRGYSVLPFDGKPAVKILKNYTFAPPDLPAPYFKVDVWISPIDRFADAYKLSDVKPHWWRYTFEYGSFIGSRSYNLGLGFIHDKNNPDPFSHFPKDDPLYSLMQYSPNEKLLHEIPEPYKSKSVVPDAADLKDMKKFVSLLKASDRPIYEFPSDGETDLWKALENRGLISKSNLALNGWVFVKKNLKLEMPPKPLKFISSGGFIVEEGDIVIQNSIEPTSSPPRSNCLLYFIALNGNIIVKTMSDQNIQAGLIAFGEGTKGGKIIFEGGPANIKGALAMRRVFEDQKELENFAGPHLSYFPALAALPDCDNENRSEKPLLTYNFEPTPLRIQ